MANSHLRPMIENVYLLKVIEDLLWDCGYHRRTQVIDRMNQRGYSFDHVTRMLKREASQPEKADDNG